MPRQGESPNGFSYWCNKAKAEIYSLGFSVISVVIKIMRKLAILYVTIHLVACINNKQETSPVCKASDTSPITYQNDIKPILTQNCLSCHSNKNHAGGVSLEDIGDVKFWASNGELYDQIIPFQGNPPRMPRGYSMTDCEILSIKKWVDSGLN